MAWSSLGQSTPGRRDHPEEELTMSTQDLLTKFVLNVNDLELEPWPLPRGENDIVVVGDPEYSGRFLYKSEDRRTVIGIERLGPCILRGTHIGETLYFLAGRVVATPPAGEPYELGAGDFCHFPPGLEDEWEIVETYVKLFHIHSERELDF
jgi:uncharacterized cupin superfamily protein